MILGDFNVHWDCQRNANTTQLAYILRSANLGQLVQEILSDSFLIHIDVSLQKQPLSATVISYKRYKPINKDTILVAGLFQGISIIVHCR